MSSIYMRAQGSCARFVFINALISLLVGANAAGVIIIQGQDSSLDQLLVPSNIGSDSSQSRQQSITNSGSGLIQSQGQDINRQGSSINQNAVTNQRVLSAQTQSAEQFVVQGNTAESYVLSSGDRISISVFDEPELSLLDLTITSDDVINYPLIGQIGLKGKTALEIQNELTSKLQQGYLVNPRVTVTVLEYRPFYIQGGVVQNGAMPYSPGLTVDKAMALAGGLRDGVRLEDLKIGRRGAPYELAESAQRSSFVNPGDVVYVPLANEGASGTYIYVYGEVTNPGRYQIYNSITVEQAIILAGGFTDFASKRKVSIKRTEAGEELELKKVKLGELVESNDIITIGAGLF